MLIKKYLTNMASPSCTSVWTLPILTKLGNLFLTEPLMTHFASCHKQKCFPLLTSVRDIIILNLMKQANLSQHLISLFVHLDLHRMSFGLTVVGDAFQHKLDTIFNNLNFCTGPADDMIIWGKETDRADHDKHLIKFSADPKAAKSKIELGTLSSSKQNK